MKRILTIVFAALLCLACHSEKTCTIRGTVTVPMPLKTIMPFCTKEAQALTPVS